MSFGSGRLPPTSPRSRLRDARGTPSPIRTGIRWSLSSLTNVVHRGCCQLLQEELPRQSVWSGRSAATTWFEPTTLSVRQLLALANPRRTGRRSCVTCLVLARGKRDPR